MCFSSLIAAACLRWDTTPAYLVRSNDAAYGSLFTRHVSNPLWRVLHLVVAERPIFPHHLFGVGYRARRIEHLRMPGAGFPVGTRLTFAGSNARNYFSRGRWIFERRALTLTGTEPSIAVRRSGCRSSLGSKFAR
jgi:hypothetical protein